MAYTYGAAVYRDSYYYARAGIDLTVSGTTVTWKTNVYFSGPTYATSPYVVSGAVSRSGNYTISQSGAGSRQYASGTFTGSRGKSYSITNKATIFFGGTATHTRSVTVPITTPRTPTSLTATRESDSKIKLAWTITATTGQPITSQELSRSTDGGAYVVTAPAMGPDRREDKDTNVSADHSYTYRVRAKNAKGWGGYRASATVYTSPAPPISVSLARSGGNIVGTWAKGSRHTVTYEAQYRQNGGTWTNWGTTSGLSLTRAAADTARWQMRVRAVIGTLTSAWVESGEVFAVPLAPDTPTVARISDAQQQVTWVNNTSADAPYSGIIVEQSTDGGAWVPVATLGIATTATISGTSAGHSYRYRVKATGTGGESGVSGASAYIYTTPLAPKNITSVKDGTTVTNTWEAGQAVAVSGYAVEDSAGGGAYVQKTTTTLLTWTDSSADPAITHRYRVRAYRSAVPLAAGGTVTLYSGYVTGPTVQLLTPPLAPKLVITPTLGDPAKQLFTASVTHQPVDSTAMTSRKLRWRKAGTSDAWTESASTAATTTFSANMLAAGFTWAVQACTKGQHPDYGPWCNEVLVTSATTPSGQFSSPTNGQVLANSTLNIGVSSGQGIAQWRFLLEKLDDGVEEVYTRTGITAASFTLPVPVAEGTYRLTGYVRNAAGLWSDPFTRSFSVAYAKPPAAQVGYVWADDGSLTLDISVPDPVPPQIAAVGLQIWRDGVLLAEVPQRSTTYVDRIPPLEGTVYTIVSVSSIPSTQSMQQETEAYDGPPAIFLNGGAGFTTLAKLRVDPAIITDPVVDKTLVQFDGRRAPVEFTGVANYTTLRLTGRSSAYGERLERLGDWRDWDAIGRLPAPVCYRDHLGRRLFVSVEVDSITHNLDPHAPISATLTEIDYEE